jgi:hypothetical protein
VRGECVGVRRQNAVKQPRPGRRMKRCDRIHDGLLKW